MEVIRSIIDIVYPHRCLACAERLFDKMSGFCEPCSNSVLEPSVCCARCGTPLTCTRDDEVPMCGTCICTPRPAIQYTWWAMEYGGAVQRTIQKIKFGGQWPLAAALAAAFRPHPQQHRLMLEWDAVIPVPLHWRRRITRGFNQSTVLARKIAPRLHLPLLTETLVRTRHTARQSQLSAAQRTANLRGAFSVRKSSDVLNKRVLLIDDVVTTGATIKACALTLKKAGAQSICVWSLCRKV